MDSNKEAYRFSNPQLRRIGLLYLITLLLLSILFFEERTLFADVPFRTFRMMLDQKMQIQGYRIGDALVQVFPFMAILFGFNVKGILVVHSLAYPVFFIFIYSLIVWVYKNDFLGLVLVLFLSLFTYHTFYWIASEIRPGLALLILFTALLLDQKPGNKVNWMIGTALAIVCSFTHPFLLIPFTFIWIYLFRKERMYMALGLIFYAGVIVKNLFFPYYYDTGKKEAFLQNLDKWLPEIWAIPANIRFAERVWEWYPFFLIFIIALITCFVYRGYYKKLLIVLGGLLLTIFVINISSPSGGYDFYQESNYLSLSLILGVPLIFDCLAKVKGRTFLAVVVSLYLILTVYSICGARDNYTERLNWYRSFYNEHSTLTERKWMMDISPLQDHPLILTWGSAYESLLLSEIENPEVNWSLFLFEKSSGLENIAFDQFHFIGKYDNLTKEDFTLKHFNLPDGYYKVLRSPDRERYDLHK